MAVVRGRWFPASMVLPGQQSRPWQHCYALAADDGLHIWRRPADTAEWHSPIDWAVTTLPTTDRAAKRGFDVYTEQGLVVVTLGSGCRCGAMGRWSGPGWARSETIRA